LVISQTPLRVSFLGGGTDYPEYFKRRRGATLVTSIRKYFYITVNRLTQFNEHRYQVTYSKIECVQKIDEIVHPAARECLRLLQTDGGVGIYYVSDLPARTGLGSSSAFTVGLLNALYAFRGEMVSRERLASEAIRVEREMLKEPVGYQDQYACSLGGFLHLEILPDGTVHANPVVLSSDRLRQFEERCLLLYTGTQRLASEVLHDQCVRTESGKNDQQLDALYNLVGEGVQVLTKGRNLSEFGELLHQSWVLKRGLSEKIATQQIDEYYRRARAAGAIGGKLLGAGAGGFLLLYVDPRDRTKVRSALSELGEVDFSMERQGSSIIFYRPD